MHAEFSPDASRIATCCLDPIARVWDSGTGKEVAAFRGHSGIVRMARFSPDGKRVITAADDGTCRLWDAGSGKQLRVFTREKQPRDQGWGANVATGAAFSPDGHRVLGAYRTGPIAVLWDAETGKKLAALEGSEGVSTERFAGFSPDGGRVVTADVRETCLW